MKQAIRTIPQQKSTIHAEQKNVGTASQLLVERTQKVRIRRLIFHSVETHLNFELDMRGIQDMLV